MTPSAAPLLPGRTPHWTWLLLVLVITACRPSSAGPEITAVSPADRAEAVATTAALGLTFDRPVANPAAALLGFSPPVAGAWAWPAPDTAVFTPLAPLRPDTTYTAVLQPGLMDAAGERAPAFQWRFTTAPPRIVFIGHDDAFRLQILTMGLDGGRPRPLTEEPRDIVDFALAPDGRHIAYAVRRDDNGSDLYRITTDGEALAPLLDCGGDTCHAPVWAPDGARLLFVRRETRPATERPAPPSLWWLDVATGKTAPLFDDPAAQGELAGFSADGRFLSFYSPATEETEVHDLSTGAIFSFPSQVAESGDWHPRRNLFLFPTIELTHGGATVHLIRLDAESGRLADISGALSTNDGSPAWSPDGRRVALGRKVPRTPAGRQLVVMDGNGDHVQTLTADINIHHVRPRWSVDSRFLLYQRFDLSAPNESPTIWLMDVVTGEERRLAEGVSPWWVP